MERGAPLIIAGGGLAGTLAAIALSKVRPDLPLLLVETTETLGGNHVWSYFDSDLDAEGHALVAPLRPKHWDAHEVTFPGRSCHLQTGYNSITSEDLDRIGRETLGSERLRFGAAITELCPNRIRLADGTDLDAMAVIDARGPAGPMAGLDLAWQKFVGIEFAPVKHGLDAPIIMDATVPQIDGYRFVYSLPFAPDRIFIEDTYYSDSADLDVPTIRERIGAYAESRGWQCTPTREETGVLPVLLDGNPERFWPAADPVARLGVTGGFFHPTTGYSLPQAIANAQALARLDDFSAPALARWTRARFLAHWRDGRFFRALNRMMFRAARPAERIRVFEHFYRLPRPVIERFYAGRLSLLDKARILTGKPPVPVVRALKALAG